MPSPFADHDHISAKAQVVKEHGGRHDNVKGAFMSIAEFSKKFHADKRGNCAMSVAYGYARATGKSEEEAVKAAEMFRAFGGGKAPDGLCGALYAAKMMQPDHAESIEDVFKRGAQGCTKCQEIRPNKIIPCNRCVELAGEALDFLEK